MLYKSTVIMLAGLKKERNGRLWTDVVDYACDFLNRCVCDFLQGRFDDSTSTFMVDVLVIR